MVERVGSSACADHFGENKGKNSCNSPDRAFGASAPLASPSGRCPATGQNARYDDGVLTLGSFDKVSSKLMWCHLILDFHWCVAIIQFFVIYMNVTGVCG